MIRHPIPTGSISAVWAESEGRIHLQVVTESGAREEQAVDFRPFAWIGDVPLAGEMAGLSIEPLRGPGVFRRIAHADNAESFAALLKLGREGGGIDVIRPFESQYLLQHRARLFAEMTFPDLRRCQLDIETASTDGEFSDAGKPEDRVLAIGLRFAGRDRMLVLDDMTDTAEKALLERLNQVLAAEDPDTIEGHNIFKFDLEYLRLRCRRHRVPCQWGRFGQRASFRKSRLKLAERWLDFPRCDLPGRTVVDTYLLVQQHDISVREMTGYGLKESAIYFGVTPEDGAGRTYLPGDRIFAAWREDRERFLAYLADDLRETAGLGDLLLPTYFEQARTFPILLQEATLRGTTGKIDLLFLEEYYHARHACPVPPAIAPFAGGFTKSFEEGVFQHVLHFDVASLYPSLLLNLGRNPDNDPLGVFIPLLQSLRDYRLRYKQLARTATDPAERAEAQARQANFKILINSFYGYLGFSGARFGDGELAAEITRQGRELLQQLITRLQKLDCRVLEADTDGIYVSSERHFADPEGLLAQVAQGLPAGIELEFDGRYEAMFCYKAKNYALRSGDRVIIRGSALRSRGTEPYLKQLGDRLVEYLLGFPVVSPLKLAEELRARLESGQFPVEELARSEMLGQNPETYEKFVAEGGKPRRAAAEVALQLSPRPRMGERVRYYLAPRVKGQTSDWQRARPVELFDPLKAPYDVRHYVSRLDDWLERYGPFLGRSQAEAEGQPGLPGLD